MSFQEALQDSECVGIIAATLEETMYNLLQVGSLTSYQFMVRSHAFF